MQCRRLAEAPATRSATRHRRDRREHAGEHATQRDGERLRRVVQVVDADDDPQNIPALVVRELVRFRGDRRRGVVRFRDDRGRFLTGRRTSRRCAAATTTTVLMMRTGSTPRRRETCSRATASPRRQRGARSASATASGRTKPAKRRAVPAPRHSLSPKTVRKTQIREFTWATPPVRAAARCSP